MSCVDLQRPSDEYHELWMFYTTRRTEEEMGRTCTHITSMLHCISRAVERKKDVYAMVVLFVCWSCVGQNGLTNQFAVLSAKYNT